MRMRCWRPTALDLAGRVALATLTVLAASGVARGQTASVPCAVQPGPVQVAGANLRLELVIDCSTGAAGAQAVPRDVDLLVGLTLYATPKQAVMLRNSHPDYRRRTLHAPPAVAAALGSGVSSRQALVAGNPRWIVLNDSDASSYDASAKPLRIVRAGDLHRIVFELRAADVGDRPHLLFAVWQQASREDCDKTSPGARSGCKRDGYVLEGDPVATYPGREISHFSHPSGDWTSERWIVERFR